MNTRRKPHSRQPHPSNHRASAPAPGARPKWCSAAGRAARPRPALAHRRHHALRMRWPDGLPPAPAGGGPARDRRAGAGRAQNLPCLDVPVVARGAGTGLSGGAMPHAMGVTLSWPSSTASSRMDPAAAPPWCSAACATWPSAKRPRRTACTTRPTPQPDRLHHRRQRGRKLGRRALPEIRPDGAQRAQGQGLHHRGRAGGVRQRGAGRARLRPAGAGDRQRGHAGRHHRGHRQAGAQAAAGALHHGQL
jgi:hypothetical protein